MKKLMYVMAMVMIAGVALAGDVSLRWDENDPIPEGYRVFVREISHAVYDYDFPAWEGQETECVIDRLEEGVSYAFIVRAFDGELESEDSDEVYWTSSSKAPVSEVVEEDFEDELEEFEELEELEELVENETPYSGGQGGCFISSIF
jgi:hypothetical protein